ncbi:hypothetical protein FM107_06280 [Sphingobacterium sp. JB170]|nr:hypothetical protein FM107_06280 [Sphingobacterium sp. JB170]
MILLRKYESRGGCWKQNENEFYIIIYADITIEIKNYFYLERDTLLV